MPCLIRIIKHQNIATITSQLEDVLDVKISPSQRLELLNNQLLNIEVKKETIVNLKLSNTQGNKQPDLNNDGEVNALDHAMLISAIFAKVTDEKFDLNADGNVNILDLSILFKEF